MGRKFAVTAYDVATGATVDTFKTLAALIAANTTGHRARLLSIDVGGAGGAAQDIQVALRLCRIAANSSGTAGTGTAVTPSKLDSDSLASIITAKTNYTAEPTTYESTHLWEAAINGRGGLIKEWPAGEGPVLNKDQTIGLLATPGTTTAVTLNVSMTFEEF